MGAYVSKNEIHVRQSSCDPSKEGIQAPCQVSSVQHRDNQAGCREHRDSVVLREENFTAYSAKLAEPGTWIAFLKLQRRTDHYEYMFIGKLLGIEQSFGHGARKWFRMYIQSSILKLMKRLRFLREIKTFSNV